ncbi:MULTISPECIES: restriction endonuclease subunit S [unclassified Cryobacterium]|uniref:restriction endonuclease subunit S n=1 Tax=unclassified Cryobacterium TaxID=2649013 RepID=UPI002AB38554|nr:MULTISPECIES: restriction endonuclease subunit S [unclassified Cryobacterium]MDY7528147.1 restriction endonuclease subunit S [Cryobacterium sp. 10C2]MDY7556104.1 restriction endonuclease subunit S [Cryobacterium sp. 10C3]MEB0289354.1 restriction endonuclease subunit S [Cryobacterium sp. 10C2]
MGSLPSHWSKGRLKDIATSTASTVDKKAYSGQSEILLCNYVDVYYQDRISSDLAFTHATASPSEIARFSLRSGDVVITKDSESADDIGIAAFVPVDLPGVVCGYHLAILRAKSNADGYFLKWLFDSTYVNSVLETRANGLTRVGLGQSALASLPVPIPPVREQREIAAYLDRETGQIDALIAKQEQLVEMLTERRQAVIAHAVTRGINSKVELRDSGVEWLGVVPIEWSVSKLKHVIADRESGTSVNATDTPAVLGEIAVLKTGSASRGVFDSSQNKVVLEEDLPRVSCPVRLGKVLINRANSPELVGAAALVREAHDNLYLSDKLWQIGFRCDPIFVYWWFQTRTYKDQVGAQRVGSSSSMQNLSYEDFREIRLAMPSRQEQEAIGAFLDSETAKIADLVSKAHQVVGALRERRQAIISAAVTGKIDVRGL